MKNEEINTPDYGNRWFPDFRYRTEKRISVPLNNFVSKDPSVVDKEAYRLTLASLRGELAQGTGKIDVGSYSIPAGQEYDPNSDFSFLNRKDLTIVELDNYMKIMKRQLETADSELEVKIKNDLAKAEKKHQELQISQNNKNDEVKE